MKRFFSSTWIILSLAILTLAPTLSLVASSEVSAGSPALQQLVDDIRSTCKDMNQSGEEGSVWKNCEDKQNKLAVLAGCSKAMFGPKDSNGKRSFVKSKLDDCQKKINNEKEVARRAQEKLDHIIKKCKDIDRAVGASGAGGVLNGEWDSCEASQNTLKAIGCSGSMFEKTSGGGVLGIAGEDHWSYIQSEVDACQKVINQIKTSPDTKPGGGTGPTTDPGSTAGGDDIPCRGGPMGWVMCPLIEIMSEALQTIAGFIDGMMQFRLLSQTNSQDALRGVWQTFLNIANVLLVVAFLVIIFSQTTSAGLSNYGIKRMLPRLVIGAILMNISFYVCAFAIDISNIVGSSVMGLFANMTDIAGWNYTDTDGVVKEAFTDKSGADGLGTGFVKYLGAGIAAVVIILFFLVPVLLSALLVFIVLVARQVILTILVIIAPLAFVAWLLPNTEQYFKKWWGLFSQMLFAYPMVMAVFGAAIFVAELIQGVNQVNSHVGAAEIGGPGIISAIVPLVVLAIPLFAIPKIIMSSNSIMGKVGGAVQKGFGATGLTGLGKKQQSAAWGITGKPITDRAGYEIKRSRPGRFFRNAAARGKNRKEFREGEFARGEAEHVAERELAATQGDRSPEAARRRALAESKLEKLAKEAMENQEILIKAEVNPNSKDELAEVLKKAIADKNEERAGAAYNLISKLGKGGIEKGRETIIGAEAANGGQLDASMGEALASSMASNPAVKDADPTAKVWAGEAGGRSFADIEANENLFRGASPQDIVKMSPESMLRGINAEMTNPGSGMSLQQRREIRNNEELWSSLAPEVRHIIQNGRKMP